MIAPKRKTAHNPIQDISLAHKHIRPTEQDITQCKLPLVLYCTIQPYSQCNKEHAAFRIPDSTQKWKNIICPQDCLQQRITAPYVIKRLCQNCKSHYHSLPEDIYSNVCKKLFLLFPAFPYTDKHAGTKQGCKYIMIFRLIRHIVQFSLQHTHNLIKKYHSDICQI